MMIMIISDIKSTIIIMDKSVHDMSLSVTECYTRRHSTPFWALLSPTRRGGVTDKIALTRIQTPCFHIVFLIKEIRPVPSLCACDLKAENFGEYIHLLLLFRQHHMNFICDIFIAYILSLIIFKLA